MLKRLIGVPLIVVVLATCDDPVQPDQLLVPSFQTVASPSCDPSLCDMRIVFASDRDGNSEIYDMTADGSVPTRLTDNTATDWLPNPSPDGSRIAFSSDRAGNYEIYVMNADGSVPTRLTNHSAADLAPGWSPDGRELVFISDRDGDFEIYVMNLAGEVLRQLTHNDAFDAGTDWSPDGGRIAFHSDRDGNYEVYVMNKDGTAVTRLTDNAAFDTSPSWHPLGASIAFASDRPGGGNWDIFLMSDAGVLGPNLTNHPAVDANAEWSPDGAWLVFERFPDQVTNVGEIYLMAEDGTGQTNLTQHPGDDRSPSWIAIPPPAGDIGTTGLEVEVEYLRAPPSDTWADFAFDHYVRDPQNAGKVISLGPIVDRHTTYTLPPDVYELHLRYAGSDRDRATGGWVDLVEPVSVTVTAGVVTSHRFDLRNLGVVVGEIAINGSPPGSDGTFALCVEVGDQPVLGRTCVLLPRHGGFRLLLPEGHGTAEVCLGSVVVAEGWCDPPAGQSMDRERGAPRDVVLGSFTFEVRAREEVQITGGG